MRISLSTQIIADNEGARFPWITFVTGVYVLNGCQFLTGDRGSACHFSPSARGGGGGGGAMHLVRNLSGRA